MAVISTSDLKPVTDDSLDHKRVLKVADAVTLLGLTPLNTWKRRGKCIFRKSVQYWKRTRIHSLSAANVPTASILNQQQWSPQITSIYVLRGKFAASFLKLFKPIKGSDDRDITHTNPKHLHSVCGGVHCTTSDSHSRKFPGWAHTNTNTHDNQAGAAARYAADTLAQVFRRKTLYGPGLIGFLPLCLCSYAPNVNTGFPVTQWRNILLLRYRVYTKPAHVTSLNISCCVKKKRRVAKSGSDPAHVTTWFSISYGLEQTGKGSKCVNSRWRWLRRLRR